MLLTSRPRCIQTHLAVLLTAATLAALAGGAPNPGFAAQPIAPRPSAQFFGLPMQFEKNAGQTDSQVDFLARGPGYALFLTPTQAVFSLTSAKTQPAKDRGSRRHREQATRGTSQQITLHMNLQSANPHPLAEGIDQSPGVFNYFLGNKPENWHVGVPAFAKVKYHAVYRGID